MPRRASHDGTVYEQILEVEAGQDTGTGCPTLPYRPPFRSTDTQKVTPIGSTTTAAHPPPAFLI